MQANLERALSIVDRYLRSVTGPKGFPALSVAITGRKKLLMNSVYGYATLEGRQKATTKTLFEIGSVSKSFASVTLLQLLDEGKVDLHKPVTEYLPWLEFNTKYRPITLHHLLTHTAGIVIGSEETMQGKPEVWRLRDLPTSAPPGTYYHYSNVGYKIVGLVVEALRERPFPEVLRERVMGPLGMRSTLTSMTNESRPKIATAYLPLHDDRPKSYGGPLVPSPWFESDTADGSICSTGSDMARYIRFILNKGVGDSGRVLSKKGFELLTSKAVAPQDGKHGEYYGYGLDVEEDGGHLGIRHTGGMIGHYCSMRIDMDDGIGVMVMVNGPGERDDVCRMVQMVIRSALAGDARLSIPKPQDPFAVENARKYAGTYVSAKGKIRVSASGKGLKLTASGRESARLQVMDEDVFYADLEGFELFPIRFLAKNGGCVEAVHGGDVYCRGGRHSDSRKEPQRYSRQYVGHYRSYSPWVGNFRVIDRNGMLLLVAALGEEHELVRIREHEFRVGSDARIPERVAFDMFVDGEAQRAGLSGGSYFRTFVP
jgi:CubicO group peptidase (beta-lactamase class C family)